MGVREHPILFGDELVRAIIAGTKTQTRRPAKVPPVGHNGGDLLRVMPSLLVNRGDLWDAQYNLDNPKAIQCPFGAVGDRLWCREAWALEDLGEDGKRLVWRADRAAAWVGNEGKVSAPFYLETTYQPKRWSPSIHMARWASRIFLDVVRVRVERVRDIDEDDARAEGVEPALGYYREGFARTWDRIYPGSWERNDWIWCVEFRRAR